MWFGCNNSGGFSIKQCQVFDWHIIGKGCIFGKVFSASNSSTILHFIKLNSVATILVILLTSTTSSFCRMAVKIKPELNLKNILQQCSYQEHSTHMAKPCFTFKQEPKHIYLSHVPFYEIHNIKYCQIDLIPALIRIATHFRSALISGSWIAIQFLLTQSGLA